MKRGVALVLAAILAAWPKCEVRADSIDGHWCFDDGRRFTIEGPKIVTPGGRPMTGDYNRHGFSYRVPAPEPATGATVSMVLLGEDLVRLTVGDGAAQLWRRCAPPTS